MNRSVSDGIFLDISIISFVSLFFCFGLKRSSRVVRSDFSSDLAGLARPAPGRAAVRKFTMKTRTEDQDIIHPPPTETRMDPAAVIPRKESTITC